MRPVISSILPSKGSPLIKTLFTLGWIVFWLLCFEWLIHITVSPASVTVEPNKLQQYIEYGRSVEGKIYRMVASSDEATAPIVPVGWLDPAHSLRRDKPAHPKTADGLLIAIYGMSFAQHVGKALVELEPRVNIRFVGGPAAPPNHTYTAYLLDKDQHAAPVVIMGIQSSRVVGMTTISSMNSSFEHPAPFTYPKYHIVAGHLEAIWPKVNNLAQLRRVMGDKILWQEYVEQLKQEDSYYDPFLFDHNMTDNSIFIRFIRRAWFKNRRNNVLKTVYGPKGFYENTEVIKVLRLMVVNFVHQARQDGRLPILMLFHNRGYEDHLFKVLADVITQVNVPTVSTHLISPAHEPKNFLPDGHFTHQANKLFAQASLDIIHKHR